MDLSIAIAFYTIHTTPSQSSLRLAQAVKRSITEAEELAEAAKDQLLGPHELEPMFCRCFTGIPQGISYVYTYRIYIYIYTYHMHVYITLDINIHVGILSIDILRNVGRTISYKNVINHPPGITIDSCMFAIAKCVAYYCCTQIAQDYT